MGTRLLLGLLWALHFLPLRMLGAIASLLAMVGARSALARTTRINLKACFPGHSLRARDQMTQAHLAALIRSFLELGILWWSSQERIRALVRFKHLEYTQNISRPIIFLTFHTVGLEIQGAVMGMAFKGVGFFTPHKNPLIDRHIRAARKRLGDVVMLERKKGLRPLMRALREGRNLYFLPDMDFGGKDSLFVPFFDIPAATVPTLPWLAKATGALVIPCACHQLPHHRGYEVEFFPPWNDFPGSDLQADLARMNQFIEQQARLHPSQYYWGHKRFRTRPDPREPYFYRWPQSLE